MAHVKAGALTRGLVPTGADSLPGTGGVKTQPCYHEENVAALDVKGEPFTEAGLTPAQKLSAGAVLQAPHHTSLAQHKANGT